MQNPMDEAEILVDSSNVEESGVPQHTPCSTYILVFVATLGGFLFGYDTGVVSGAMLEIKHPGSGIASETQRLSNVAQEAIVSSTVAAAAIGSLVSGLIQRSTLFGRRTCAIIAAVMFAFGAILMAVITSFELLLLGRIIVGVAVGIASQVVPIFIAESSPAHLRGTLTALNNSMLVVGQVAASGVCCAYARSDHVNGTLGGWRWMLGWGAVPAIIMIFGLFMLPESPRWQVAVRGDTENARKALLWSRDSLSAAEKELAQITEAAAIEDNASHRVGKLSLMGRLLQPRVRRALLLGVGLLVLNQCVGINTIMYYSATILQMASEGNNGIGNHCAEAIKVSSHNLSASDVRNVCETVPVASCQLLGTFIGILLADRKGRRPLVLLSLVGCVASLFGLGFAFFPEADIGWLALVGMCVYLLSFGIGMSTVPWVVNAEIYPLDERSVASSIAVAANWVANFIVSFTFLDIAAGLSTNRDCPEEHPDGAFWLYGVVALIGFVFLWWLMPETAGKTLEEMHEVFECTSDQSSGESQSD